MSEITASFQEGAALLYGASRAGKRGGPCQDGFCLRGADDSAVVAVADGVGSSPRGAEGAQLAAELACGLGLDYLRWRTSGRDWELASRFDGREDVLALAELLRESWLASLPPGDPHDFATTLLCAGWHPDHCFLVMAGDGAAVVALQDGSTLSLTKPLEEWSNVVTPLGSPRLADEVRGQLWRAATGEFMPRALALFTDGISERVQRTGLRPLLQGLCERVRDEATGTATFRELTERLDGCDDMTMALLKC